jgi:hypothetical protein
MRKQNIFVNLFTVSVKRISSMYEVNTVFVRNGANAYVKNPRVFLREKSAKRVFMKSSSHSSTTSGNSIGTMQWSA